MSAFIDCASITSPVIPCIAAMVAGRFAFGVIPVSPAGGGPRVGDGGTPAAAAELDPVCDIVELQQTSYPKVTKTKAVRKTELG